MSGGLTTFQVSTYTSERIDSGAYTDAAPSTTFVRSSYPASNNPCPSDQVVPLIANKRTLNIEISALTAGRPTAVQVRIAWGWFMLSPNSGYIWPNAENAPASYTTPDTIKVAVFMTDGEFNTIYSSGVIAQDGETIAATAATRSIRMAITVWARSPRPRISAAR